LKKKLIWLECCGCSGNIISFLDSRDPSFETLTRDYIDLVYNNSHMANFGSHAMDIFFDTIREGGYILCIEGAVSTADNGIYNIIGYYNGRLVTGLEAVQEASKNASHIIAVGTCASYGGPSAAPPNPSGSKSVYDVLGSRVIRMPACPCNGDWIASLIVSLVENKPVELDSSKRPLYLYGFTIHDRCERRAFFDKGIFAKRLGDPWCMFNLGCRGPSTKAPCPVTRWNDFINWPVGSNSPCIGCAKPDFPDFNFFTREGLEDE
jgi:hydrogenase small subunit